MKFLPSNTPAAIAPAPTPRQLAWHRRELSIFVHFGMNTFTGLEWGDGRTSPGQFAPTAFNADQWAAAARAAGARSIILTAKHHDGFCLWPSRYTDYSVSSSGWRDGKSDVVRAFVDAARRHDLIPGLYLSPWDRHEPRYGESAEYNQYYINQLTELLTEYGELGEIWFDGACGEGPNAKRQEYDWPAFFEVCQRLQPNAVTFGDGGTDVRWVGNERGNGGDPNWNIVDSSLVKFPGDSGADRAVDARATQLTIAHELQHGNPNGNCWRPAEVNVSIRPGWFYHDGENQQVRSVSNLVELHFRSVGRGSPSLLNVPPDRRGLMHEIDVERLAGMRRRLDDIFANDLTHDATAMQQAESTVIHFPEPRTINLLRVAEAIEWGQRIERFTVHSCDVNGNWSWLIDGDTIGYQRLLRFDAIVATALRVTVTASRASPIISEIAAFG